MDDLLGDELASKLVAYFIVNFSSNYLKVMKGDFKDEVSKILQLFRSNFEHNTHI